MAGRRRRRATYLQISRGDLILHLSNHHDDGTPGTAVLVETRGVADLHTELHATGYRHVLPGLEPHPRGREVTVIDPASNRVPQGLGVGSRLPQSLGHVRDVHSEIAQDVEGHAVSGPKQRAEDVLGANRVMSQPFAFADDALSNAGRTWRQRQLSVRRQPLAHPDDPCDRRSHAVVRDARLRQKLRRPRSVHPQEPKEEMLRPDVAVTQQTGLGGRMPNTVPQ